MDEPSGYVGNTDYDWYSFLHQRSLGPEPPDEVNFWRPSGRQAFGAIKPGSPFFFKLRAPHSAVAGFGYFARFSRATLSMAWEAFGEKNGAGSFEEFRGRLVKLLRAPIDKGEDPVIGCVMISDPVFFPKADWVSVPSDFADQVQRGKTYGVATGEGLQLWKECQARVLKRAQSKGPDSLVAEQAERYGAPVLVRPRYGQGSFSLGIRDAYGACAVTREHSLPVLEAAHIKPYSKGGEHRFGNGLCLRSDIHRLYDAGYVTVDPNHEFRVSQHLKENWKNGKAYYALQGTKILLPSAPEEQPDAAMLEWHRDTLFKG